MKIKIPKMEFVEIDSDEFMKQVEQKYLPPLNIAPKFKIRDFVEYKYKLGTIETNLIGIVILVHPYVVSNVQEKIRTWKYDVVVARPLDGLLELRPFISESELKKVKLDVL